MDTYLEFLFALCRQQSAPLSRVIWWLAVVVWWQVASYYVGVRDESPQRCGPLNPLVVH